MYDLHTHSLLSDGQLLPSEMAQRYKMLGYEAIAITDHIDESNMESVVPKIVAVSKKLTLAGGIIVLPGAELTHVPVKDIEKLIIKTRSLGAKIILVHGETLAEPVARGTNKKALQCNIDILAHPGLISREEALIAARKNIYLEITARRSHAFTNGHVAKMAKSTGAKLVINSDSHTPEDLLPPQAIEKIAQGAGLDRIDVVAMKRNARALMRKLKTSLL